MFQDTHLDNPASTDDRRKDDSNLSIPPKVWSIALMLALCFLLVASASPANAAKTEISSAGSSDMGNLSEDLSLAGGSADGAFSEDGEEGSVLQLPEEVQIVIRATFTPTVIATQLSSTMEPAVTPIVSEVTSVSLLDMPNCAKLGAVETFEYNFSTNEGESISRVQLASDDGPVVWHVSDWACMGEVVQWALELVEWDSPLLRAKDYSCIRLSMIFSSDVVGIEVPNDFLIVYYGEDYHMNSTKAFSAWMLIYSPHGDIGCLP